MRNIRTIFKFIRLGVLCSCLFLLILTSKIFPQEKTVLRIGTSDEVKSANILLDPHLYLLAHISNPSLMKMDQDLNPVNQLTSDVQVSPDLTEWILHIRQDLFWSNGQQVTPDDIKFSLEYLRDKYPPAMWMREMVKSITVLNSDAVKIELTKPHARLDFDLTTYRILPKRVWEKIDNPMRYTNIGHNVGCGPFAINRINLHGQVITLIKNPYWKGEEPRFDVIEIHIYKSHDVLSLALERGDVDVFYEYASSYPYASLRRLRSHNDFDFMENLNMGVHFLACNLKKEPMSDIRFRQAIAYAINYPEIVKLITLGYGAVPRRGFIPRSMAHPKETPHLEYDPDRAKKMLEEAGYVDSNGNGIIEDARGRDLYLLLLVDSDKQHMTRLAELIKDYLDSVGLKIRIKAVERASWVNLKDNYRYDMLISRTSPWGMVMHANWGTGYFDTRRSGEGVLHTVDDPAFLEICDSITSTLDEDKLKASAHKLQDYYAENLPAIALFWNIIVIPYNKTYTGWVFDHLYGLYNIDSFLKVEKKAR